MKPFIGILASPHTNNQLENNLYGQDYLNSIRKANGIPLLIPYLKSNELIDTYLKMCDGLLIPGGIDVDPRCYQEEKHSLCQETNYDYDQYQISIINKAIDLNVPILGICRGLQIINVALGGTLWQDLSLQSNQTINHAHKGNRTDYLHSLIIDDDTLLSNINLPKVNSFHHQGIKDLGKDLKVIAKSEDGTIEAIQSTNHHFILAVQFHPENFVDTNDEMLKIFKILVNASNK